MVISFRWCAAADGDAGGAADGHRARSTGGGAEQDRVGIQAAAGDVDDSDPVPEVSKPLLPAERMLTVRVPPVWVKVPVCRLGCRARPWER